MAIRIDESDRKNPIQADEAEAGLETPKLTEQTCTAATFQDEEECPSARRNDRMGSAEDVCTAAPEAEFSPLTVDAPSVSSQLSNLKL